MKDINNSPIIICTEYNISRLEKTEEVKRYLELSNKFDCIRYMFLLETYLYGNSKVREVLKDDIKELELFNENVMEYISLYHNDVVVKYLQFKELLETLKIDSQRKKR